MSTKIYISGKISGLPHAIALSKFKVAERMLIEEDYAPINPMELNHTEHDQSWKSFMRVDLKALCDCDVIYMLNNYEESRGAKIELQLARDLGMKIIYEL